MNDLTDWVQGVSPQRDAAAWLKGWEIVVVIALMDMSQGRDQEPAKQAFLLEKIIMWNKPFIFICALTCNFHLHLWRRSAVLVLK